MRILSTLTSAVQTGTGNVSNVRIVVPEGQRYDSHQLVIVCTGGTPSAGTVTPRCKAVGSSRFIAPLGLTGVAETISLATEDSLTLSGGLEAVEVDMAGLAGSGITSWYAQLNLIA